MSRSENITDSEFLALPIPDAMEYLATIIDEATDSSSSELNQRALDWCEAIRERPLEGTDSVLLDYFHANAWSNLHAQRSQDRGHAWAWDQEESQQIILCLRRAVRNSSFNECDPIYQCQILTNLGNQLDTIGRFVEARDCWNKALEIEPEFWMARGNRGKGLLDYANALYDSGHQGVFGIFALDDLRESLRSAERAPHLGYEAAANYFAARGQQIEDTIDVQSIRDSYTPDGHSLGECSDEQAYRSWCLSKRLFLNPLNDVDGRPIAAHDALHLPSFATGLDEPPIVIGMYNQLKQEYASARWLCFDAYEALGFDAYEALGFDTPHFSDRGVLLIDTLDYPAQGLSIEKLKLSFRSAYSLFDKIAFFLNHYMKLNIAAHRVSFRGIWRTSPHTGIRDEFAGSENWPLRGLYWLSKDFFEDEFKASTDPDAEAISELRNHLEHRYTKIVEMALPRRAVETDDGPIDPFEDTLAYTLSYDELRGKTLRMLKLARAALIYLSLGMHLEESRRARSREPSEFGPVSMSSYTLDDERKF